MNRARALGPESLLHPMQGHLDVVPVDAQLRADVLRAAQALSGRMAWSAWAT